MIPRDPAEERRMRLSREVRIGELVATLVALSTIAGTYIEMRLDPVRSELRALKERNREQDDQQLELKREIRDDIRVLREKLDRVIEVLPRR